jgi:hypothetical protein
VAWMAAITLRRSKDASFLAAIPLHAANAYDIYTEPYGSVYDNPT